MNIPFQLIVHCIDADKIRNLAVFMKMKSRFANGCYFNYNIAKIARDNGISRNQVRKFITEFKADGWVREHAQNLTFISFKKICQTLDLNNTRDIIKSIDVTQSITQIISALRFELLKRKGNQFDYMKKAWNDKLNPTTLPAFKRANRIVKKARQCPTFDESSKYAISFIGLGKLFNCSISMAAKIIKGFIKNGLIQKTLNFKRVKVYNHEAGLIDSRYCMFISKNHFAYVFEKSTYIFL